MDIHDQPCADLKVTQNNVKHLEDYIRKDVVEKIEDVRSDLKSDFISVKTGSKLSAELLQKNVDEQREMRVDMTNIKNVADVAKLTSDKMERTVNKLMFLIVGGLLAVFLSNVGNMLTNMNNQKDTAERMDVLSQKLSAGAIQDQIEKQLAKYFKKYPR